MPRGFTIRSERSFFLFQWLLARSEYPEMEASPTGTFLVTVPLKNRLCMYGPWSVA
jgi:hypothetical protein